MASGQLMSRGERVREAASCRAFGRMEDGPKRKRGLNLPSKYKMFPKTGIKLRQ